MIKQLIKKFLISLLPIKTIKISELFDTTATDCQISQNGVLKFIQKQPQDGKFVLTPEGLIPILQVFKTIPYTEYELKLHNNMSLICADEHIVSILRGDIQVQNLIDGDVLNTIHGPQRICSLKKTTNVSNMYDLELDSDYHYYFTNGILSHNTTTIGAFLLWYAMFHEDQTVLVVSNKGDNAKEVIERIKFMYESCPLWLKPGVTEDGYNKHSLRFDNKSRIISQATSENSGRGLSISLLFCYVGDNTVELKDENDVEFTMTLEELYEYLGTE